MAAKPAEHADTTGAGSANTPSEEEDLPVGAPTKAAAAPLSVEALEDSLLAGLLGPVPKKRPRRSTIPETDPAFGSSSLRKKPVGGLALKRPAAHAPSASNIDMSGIFAKLRSRKGTLSRKCFTSQAYHGVRVLAESKGFSSDEAKALAREASRKASAMYEG